MLIPISQFITLPPPLPLPLSPLGVHMFVLYICVSISALQTSSPVPFFYVPHICVNIRYLFFSFWLTSLCMTVSRFIHISTNDPICSFLWLIIFHCIYVPRLLYPFICQWSFRLLPWPGYCKECCNEHWGACVFLNYGFLWVYAQ